MPRISSSPARGGGTALIVRHAAAVQCLMLTLAFATLLDAFAESDFSLKLVAEHSHTLKPMLYKITAAWGNHKGSMLLWAWILSIFGCLLAISRRPYPPQLRLLTLAVQGALAAGIVLFILTTSNPFLPLSPVPSDGADLNPLLQDIGLALHPPMLYLGYVGFSLVFSFAVAGLVARQITPAWAHVVRPWALVSWSFLTLGIALGSWWAYRELGWGGYWFWDPVENVSLLPWLSGTALVHSILVLERKNALHRWVALLAILTFLFSLLGTFLVRSGLLVSVHSFASDPTRGLFILGYIGIVACAALAIYATRAPSSIPSNYRILSRTGGIVINNLLLFTACLTVAFATLYPLGLELLEGAKISVGAPYYNTVFFPLVLPLLPLAAAAPFFGWDADRPGQMRPIILAFASAGLITLCLAALGVTHTLALLGFGCSAALAAGALLFLAKRTRLTDKTLRRVPLHIFGGATAHLGLAILAAGITGSTLFKQESSVTLSPKDSVEFSGFALTHLGDEGIAGSNYLARRSTFSVVQDSREIAQLAPEYRYYPVRGSTTSETAIYSTWNYDLYIVTGAQENRQGLRARLYYAPLMNWIWTGALLMAAGGLLAARTPQRKGTHG